MSLLKYPFSFKQLKNYYRTSTHAPVKGATETMQETVRKIIISIHAPAKGATPAASSLNRYSVLFQSTPPRRERQTVAFQSKGC